MKSNSPVLNSKITKPMVESFSLQESIGNNRYERRSNINTGKINVDNEYEIKISPPYPAKK